MKVVLDTSLLIAGWLKDGICRKVLMTCLKDHRIFISEALLLEFLTLAREPVFAPHKKQLEFFLEMLAEAADMRKTKASKTQALRDSDQKYIDLAETVKADVLITTSSDLVGQENISDTHILSPKDFINQHAQKVA